MTESNASSGAAAQNDAQTQFAVQRIYTKDLSFESPKSPQIFQQKWEPAVSLELNTKLP